MTKPLELTVYPKVELADDWLPRDRLKWAADREKERQAAKAKHLSDAELAAEAYRQMARAFAVVGAVMVNDMEFAPADAAGDGPLSVESQQLRIIKRFATSPHYFEEPT